MSSSERTPYLRLSALTGAAVLLQGYHLGVDDAAIYVPAIKKVADPALYPFGDEFFMTHARLSFFPNLVGGFARVTRISSDAAIFLCYAVGIFLLLLAGWRLLAACFDSSAARWGGVVLLAMLLPVPVAGTALAIMDPYVTARSLSTPATFLAIAAFLAGRTKTAALWLVVAALIHPQMAVYAGVFLGAMSLARHPALAQVPAYGALTFPALPFLFPFHPATGPAREALLSRTYFFLFNWTWYELLGVVAPLAILWLLSSARLRNATPALRPMLRSTVAFGLLFTAAGLIVSSTPDLENFARLQPMRAFHLIYIVLFLLLGALLTELAVEAKRSRWLMLSAPLIFGMWLLQVETYPASPHLELPGVAARDVWESAFFWIRDHTPKDAVFALDPDYMLLPGEDLHGFRAVAQRSVLADEVKDSGAVSLFPQLAEDWKQQVDAQAHWSLFALADFRKLAQRYPVTWVVTRDPARAGLTCPYRNGGVAVCKL